MEAIHLHRRKPKAWAGIFLVAAAVLGGWSGNLSLEDSCPPLKVVLDGDWRFREKASENWLPARVPGCVHLDLMENGVISDPFYRDNEIRVQWVEERDWIYEKEFDLDKEVLKRTHVELVCEGLDTFAALSVNGVEVAQTDNMFRVYCFEVRPFLRAGRNRLRIRFDSPVRRSSQLEEKLAYRLPGEAPHVRKAPYHFGWDWGPRLATSGIWSAGRMNGERVSISASTEFRSLRKEGTGSRPIRFPPGSHRSGMPSCSAPVRMPT